MKVLYNSLHTSKALSNNNVKKNTSSTTTDCKSFHSGFTKIENSVTRTSFKSNLCVKIISSIRQFDLKYITCQYLYKLYEEKYSDYQILNACKELVELNILKSDLKQVDKYKFKYEFEVNLKEVETQYIQCCNSILNDNRLTPEALKITLYLMTHNSNYIITLENIKKILNLKSDRHANKYLNQAIELGYVERYFYYHENGKRETRIRALNKTKISKVVDNFVEKEISTNEKKVTVTFSKTNIETNSSLKNKKERNFKKVLNKSISISQLTTNVVEDAQLEVIQQEVFNPLVELESDNIREVAIIDAKILNNYIHVPAKYTLANLCNPFSVVGFLNDDVAKVIRELSGRKFSNDALHKIICDMQVRYLQKNRKLPIYDSLNSLIVSVIEMIKKEQRDENEIRTYENFMPLHLKNAIALSQYKFTEYQLFI